MPIVQTVPAIFVRSCVSNGPQKAELEMKLDITNECRAYAELEKVMQAHERASARMIDRCGGLSYATACAPCASVCAAPCPPPCPPTCPPPGGRPVTLSVFWISPTRFRAVADGRTRTFEFPPVGAALFSHRPTILRGWLYDRPVRYGCPLTFREETTCLDAPDP
ncbi:MAG: hypothetical protein PHW10_00005 [Candidatus Peribacteraceae bacterium]|nr:hypothetical protein [Candidatus Peribacteraceae bacterium]